MSSKTIFGIDLGTTYSCIAKVDEHSQPVVLPSAEGYPTTPSVVFFENESSISVGDTAKDAAPLYPDRVAAKFKRRMGDPLWCFEADGKEYRAQVLSAQVLRKLAADAEVASGQKVAEVVITCPAYFGIAQKEATRQAGELAGFKVHHVIPEPTAAAIAYGMRTGKRETVLVYDLGGGTFDVTLIDIGDDKQFTVLTTGGDAELGGTDWDAELTRYIASKVGEAVSESTDQVLSDKELFAALMLLAENAKRQLTNREKTVQVVSHQGEKVKVEISREDFEAMTATLLDRTIRLTHDTIRVAAERGHAQPTRICLVGGSSYMPQVRKRLEREFPGLEMNLEDPNQIVAKGAALFGLMAALDDRIIEIINEQSPGAPVGSVAEVLPDRLEGVISEAGDTYGLGPSSATALAGAQVKNVTSRGFAVEVLTPGRADPVAAVLVHVDDPVPAQSVREFGLAADNQNAARIAVYETERRTREGDDALELGECKLLGEGEILLDRGYPMGTPIEVMLGLTADGTLDVSAIHKDSGRQCTLNLKVTGVMSQAELADAKQQVTALRLT